jgi:hypothetical protein
MANDKNASLLYPTYTISLIVPSKLLSRSITIRFPR